MILHPRPSRSPRTWLALAIVAAYALGCAALGPPSAAKTYTAALTTYQGLALGMASYCSQPAADANACIDARGAAKRANEAIDATERARLTGGATDALYGAAAIAINEAIPQLQRAQTEGR